VKFYATIETEKIDPHHISRNSQVASLTSLPPAALTSGATILRSRLGSLLLNCLGAQEFTHLWRKACTCA